ncbi:MAG TPA: hypothetical protein VFL27_13740 [Candidatus Dormibacteraeota bacterium]|nr:hypothetical protein [Candidatus Dormibacteraeota bacterium]
MLTAHADPPGAAYIAAVQQAYNLVHDAPASDTSRADAAIRVLTDGTGDTQPEIIADLKARPPLYGDATTRLANLLAALGHPVTTGDPDGAKQRLHDVLSSDRYRALHSPPSLLERFAQWVQDRISDLFRLLFGSRAGGSVGTSVWVYLVGFAVLGVAVFMLISALRGRFTQPASISPEGPRPAADYFAEADRLAAKGDRIGGIRALCAAVAATLAGEGSWSGSPLTVREIFQKSPDFTGLRPLLLPFEAAVYGGRDVDQATYDRAAKVAAAYRRPVEKAA